MTCPQELTCVDESRGRYSSLFWDILAFLLTIRVNEVRITEDGIMSTLESK